MKKHFYTQLFTALILICLSTSCVIVHSTEKVESAPYSHYDIDPYQFAKLYTAVWMEHAAEYDALCMQAYNIATLRLKEALADPANRGKKLAIVTDVDETILNNAPYAVKTALDNNTFTAQGWNEWCDNALAKAIPGSLSFFQDAAKHGVTIFYITNRNRENVAGTIRNLKALGFPNADAKYVMPRLSTSDKEPRRQTVSKEYKIIMLCGDNLGDFSNLFDHQSISKRADLSRKMEDEFGKLFIVLPNPNYGTWENAITSYVHKLTPKEKFNNFKHKATAF